MPGGLFAIGRKQFDRLGGFDPGMDMWGGENFEMSFKVRVHFNVTEVIVKFNVVKVLLNVL